MEVLLWYVASTIRKLYRSGNERCPTRDKVYRDICWDDGYISSYDYKREDDTKLAKLAQKLRAKKS